MRADYPSQASRIKYKISTPIESADSQLSWYVRVWGSTRVSRDRTMPAQALGRRKSTMASNSAKPRSSDPDDLGLAFIRLIK